MITLIDGLQGSGKSYYMVRHIVLNHAKYFKVFTNINDFKFDSFTNVEFFSNSSFVDVMQRCNSIYLEDGNTDQDILDFLVSIDFIKFDDKNNVIPVLVVVDEISNILENSSSLWIWILSYHRHLFLDFVFATVDASLLHRVYHKLFQKIYRALPADRNLKSLFGFNNSNRYQEHLKLPIRDGSHGTFLKNIYIKKEQKYYDLYQAGDAVRTKSVFARFIYYFIFFAVVSVIGFFWFISTLMGSSDETKNIKKEIIHSSKIIDKDTKIKYDSFDYSDATYLKLSCISNYCTNKDYSITLYINDLSTLLKETDSKVLSTKTYSKSLAIVTLLVSESFLSLFERKYNGKASNSSISFIN